MAAKEFGRVVAGRELAALPGREQGTDHGAAVGVEVRGDAFPVEEGDTARGAVRIEGRCGGGLGFHERARVLADDFPPNQSSSRSRWSSFSFLSTPQR